MGTKETKITGEKPKKTAPHPALGMVKKHRRLLRGLLFRFGLSALLSRGVLLSGHAPFGLGFIAASGSGLDGVAALAGGLLGYGLGMDTGSALRYAAAAILIYTVEFSCFDLRLYRQKWFMAVCSSVITAVTGFVYLSGAGWNSGAVISFGSEVLLVGVSCLLFRELKIEEGQTPDRAALLFFLSAALAGIAGIHPGLGGAAAALAVLIAARSGAGAGAAVGGMAGLAVGLTAGGTPLLGVVLAAAGAATGRLAGRHRLESVLMFACSGLLCTLWVHGGAQTAGEIAAAAIVCSAIPETLLRRADSLTGPGGQTAPAAGPVERSSAVERTRFRLEEQAAAFRTLYERISESVLRGEPQEDTAVIFDRTMDRVCTGCFFYPVCWQRDYAGTCKSLTQVLEVMLDSGNATMKDYPEPFRRRCNRLEEFLRVSNEELYGYWNRQRCRSRLQNNRLAVCRQYIQMADLLSDAAAVLGEEVEEEPAGAAAAARAAATLGIEARCSLQVDERGRRTLELRGKGLSALNGEQGIKLISGALGVRMEPTDAFRVRKGQQLVFHQCPPLSATVAVSSRRKQEGQANGDNGLWFRDNEGILWVALCDGMGSGTDAARDSRLLTTLLKDFLHAGVPPAAALATLTGALSLRGEVSGGFTTVDLLRLDLFSGSTELFKLGGAPTYLRRGGLVSRITGSALPAGLETDRESQPEVTRFRLSAEDFVLMVTDGITDGTGDEWLKAMLSHYQGESPRELAQAVLSSPGAGREDDRTVVAVRLSKRV